MLKYHFIILSFIISLFAGGGQVFAQDSGISWDGVWFKCEFSGRNTPPPDDCEILDDDGFLFEKNRFSHVKLLNGREAAACKKQRAGECFRASEPSITVSKARHGKAKLTPTSIGLRYFGCTQVFDARSLGNYLEAKPAAKKCFFTRDRYFYLRRYAGAVVIK